MAPLNPEVLRFAIFLLGFITKDLENHLAEIGGGQAVDPDDNSPTVGPNLNSKSLCGLPNERVYAGDGQCYELETQGPCPRNQLFIDDSDGRGTCNCPNWNDLYHSETRKCYKRNSQGPCDEGEWLAVEEGSSGRTPVCEPVPEGCIADGRHVYMLVDRGQWGALEPKKECMKLGTQGHCADDEIVYRLNKSDQIVCRSKQASGNKVSQVQNLLEKMRTEENGQIEARGFRCQPGQPCPLSSGRGFG